MLRNKSKTSITPQASSYAKCHFVGLLKQKCHVLLGVGHVIFNRSLWGVTQFGAKWKRWVMCFLSTTFSNATTPHPPPILFDISRPLILSGVSSNLPSGWSLWRHRRWWRVYFFYISFFILLNQIQYESKKNLKFLRRFKSWIKQAQFCSFVEEARTWSEVISIHPLGKCFIGENNVCCFLGIGRVYSEGDNKAR